MGEAAVRMALRLRMQRDVCEVMVLVGGAMSPEGEPGIWPDMKRRREGGWVVVGGRRMAWDFWGGGLEGRGGGGWERGGEGVGT